MEIRFLVTREKFDEVFTIDDWLSFDTLLDGEVYQYMLKFAADEDGKPLTEAEARAFFKKVPKPQFPAYVLMFVNAVREAFVPKANGSSSAEPPSAEPA